MNWIAESSPSAMLACGVVAVVLLIAWRSTRRSRLLWGIAVAVVVAIGAFLIDRQVVTPREEVTARIHALCDSFEQADPATVEFISTSAPELRGQMAGALQLVTVEDELSVTDVSVRLTNQESRAVSHFRANGFVSFRGFGGRQYPTRWSVTWQREGDEWRIVHAESLDPITGEPNGLASRIRM